MFKTVTRKKNMDPGTDKDLIVGMYDVGFLKDQDFITWKTWHILSEHYRLSLNNQKSYECAIKGIEISPTEYKHLFYYEISIVSYYLGKMNDGYNACDKILFSVYPDERMKINTYNNMMFYITRHPLQLNNKISGINASKHINVENGMISYCKYNPESGEIIKQLHFNNIHVENNMWSTYVYDNDIYIISGITYMTVYRIRSDKCELVKCNIVTNQHLNLSSIIFAKGAIDYCDGWILPVCQLIVEKKYLHRFIWINREFTAMKYSKSFMLENYDYNNIDAENYVGYELCMDSLNDYVDTLFVEDNILQVTEDSSVIIGDISLISESELPKDNKIVFLQMEHHRDLESNTKDLSEIRSLNRKYENTVQMYESNRSMYQTQQDTLKIAIVGYKSNMVGYWDPDSTHRGLPGSEEAVVYITDELCKRGHIVTVYMNPPPDSIWSLDNSNQKWLSVDRWDDTNNNEQYDLVVMWRTTNVQMGRKRGKKVFYWAHDHAYTERAEFPNFDGVLVLTLHHWDRFSINPGFNKIPYAICGNGILLSQFSNPMQIDNPYSIGYFSNYARGLPILLLIWPEIKREFPEATLDIYYGRETWTNMSDINLKIIVDKMEQYKSLGVTEHGKVGHQELANIMCKTSIWGYPCTSITETFCITAVKCQAAGCIPVTTRIAALNETVHPDAPTIPLITNPIDIIKYQDLLLSTMRRIRDSSPDNIQSERMKYVHYGNSFSWKSCVDKWLNLYHTVISQ